MKVDVVVLSNHKGELPKYATSGSAGFDFTAGISEDLVIAPNEVKMVPSGLCVGIPMGMELQVRPRSGLALKAGVTVLNSPGTIDSDYRGEIGIILINHSNCSFTVHPGDRIAQGVLSKVEKVEWSQVETLDITLRGEGGFGHSGI